MNGRYLPVVLLTLGLITTGCFSMSTMHSARPIKKKNVEMQSAFVGVGVVSDDVPTLDPNDGNATEKVSFALPSGETQIRYGFGERFDAGAKLFFPGFGVDFNILLVNQPKFALSIDPSATLIWLPIFGVSHIIVSTVWLPVLMDVLDVKYLTITVGVKPGMLIFHATNPLEDNSFYGSGSDLTYVDGYAGGMLGFKIKFGEDGEFYLIPEGNVAWQFKSKLFWWEAVLALGYTF